MANSSGAGGKVLKVASFAYGQGTASPPSLPSRPPVSKLGGSLRVFTVDSKAGSGLRYRVAAFSVGSGRTLVVAVPLREVDQTLHRLIVVEGLVGGPVIVMLIVARVGRDPGGSAAAGANRSRGRRDCPR